MQLVNAIIGESKEKVIGKVINNGTHIVVIKIEKGKSDVLKVIPVIEDITIIDIIDTSTTLFNKMSAFFEKLFRKVPTYIDYLDSVYRLTIQPDSGNYTDKVFYLIEKPKKGMDNILFEYTASGNRLFLAKNKMRDYLKGKELV